MALRKLDKVFSPKSKEINYLNKTFPQFRQSLIDFAKVYYPDTYTDFNESSPGMMFIEMAAYVGDVLSYYTDAQFKENLPQYSQELDNVLSIAQSFGYKPKPRTAASVTLDVYQICPALDVTSAYALDSTYLLKIDSGMILSSPQFKTQFRTLEVIDFSNELDREVTVYSVDGLNNPLTYLVKKKVTATAGTIKTYTATFGAPQKFSKITISDSNILEILRVLDSNSNTWYETDYLAQDMVFEDKNNLRSAASNESTAPFYILKLKKQARRFVTRYDKNYNLEIQFGSGVVDDSDARVVLDAKRIANSEYENYLASTPLDPANFLSSKSYGLAPSNTTLTITYSTGGGIDSNVPSNSITKIDNVVFLNDTSGYSTAQARLFEDIKLTVAVNNSQPATGGKDQDSIDEIKQNAVAFFNAQNRLVTPEDYIVRCFAMPAKYGGVAKSFVAREDHLMAISTATNTLTPPGPGDFVPEPVGQNKVNLYVLGYNGNKRLTTLNADTKTNLKNYLEAYRMLTDEINILDAFVVNIGVEFKVIVYRNYNMNEVLARCIDAITQFFDISKWDINQPIILNDLLLEIASVDGVQNVSSLKVFNKYQYRDGSDYWNFLYDLDAATDNGIIYPSLDPCIFELRYPETDIIANAIQ
jgi:hypothetical protein